MCGKEGKIMCRNAISGIMLALLLIGISISAFNIQSVKSESTTITVPDDYSTIQAAINAASSGDTVYVRAGTYYENVVINKTLSLVGQDRNATIIDGNGSGTVVSVTAANVSVTNLTLRNSGSAYWGKKYSGVLVESTHSTISHNIINNNYYGVYVGGSHNNVSYNTVTNNREAGIYNIWNGDNNTLSENFISHSRLGIWIYGQSHHIKRNVISDIGSEGMHVSYSSYNSIVGNEISRTRWGLILDNSLGNHLRDNEMRENEFNFGIWHPIGVHDIDTSNLVDGKPIYYLAYEHNKTVPNDAGYVFVAHSSNILIEKLSLRHNQDGIQLYRNCDNVTIRDLDASENQLGLNIYGLRGNLRIHRNNLEDNSLYGIFIQGVSPWSRINITQNNIADNKLTGIYIEGYFGNELNVYHNDFINNYVTIYTSQSSNMNWDDGYPSGGNYWSNYEERYPNATEIDDSGIWDTPYVIDANNQDNYPLVGPWTPIPRVEDTEAYTEYVNETIQELSDELFNKTAEDVPDIKNDFSDLFNDTLENINEGNYVGAIEKLNMIKQKIYEEMVECAERQELISLIDDLIAYLETLL